MTKSNKIFATWNDDDVDDDNPDAGFWMQYETLEDAVSENGDGIEVYEMSPKLLGTFNRKVSIVKSKKK